MMKEIKQDKKNVSKKNIQDLAVQVIYETKKMRVYEVNIKEGKFTVIDYQDRRRGKSDTEVFWQSRAQSVPFQSPEFKAANKAVENYIQPKKP